MNNPFVVTPPPPVHFHVCEKCLAIWSHESRHLSPADNNRYHMCPTAGCGGGPYRWAYETRADADLVRNRVSRHRDEHEPKFPPELDSGPL